MGHEFKAYSKKTGVNVMIANMPSSKEGIYACPHLKLINVAFTRDDHVDLEVARDCHIQFFNARGYSTEAVAEFILAFASFQSMEKSRYCF